MLYAAALLALLTLPAPAASFIGINLGNVLEAPTEGAWAPAAQEYYFDDYVTQGFTRVRVPVRWDQHMGQAAPYAIAPDFMARVHEVVGWGLARNLTVLVNSHHDDWIDNSTQFAAQLPRFLALWTQVAASFASAPPTLLFEVLNEPVNLNIDQLNQLYAAVVPLMRAQNPTRAIYLGGLSWMSAYWIASHPDAVAWPALPSGQADPHLRLEVHSYDPYAFCLQSPPSASTWGTPSDVAAVQSACPVPPARARRARLWAAAPHSASQHTTPHTYARGARHVRQRLCLGRAARARSVHGGGWLPGGRAQPRWPPGVVQDCRRSSVPADRGDHDLGRRRELENLQQGRAHVGH